MITVGMDELYAGAVGSKQTVITGTGTIMKFESNFQATLLIPAFTRSVVVENLIIDGQGAAGTTGLLLENVGGAFIRNITIRNCDVGIHLRNIDGGWTETNHLQHIRMENVKKGILFNTSGSGVKGPGDSFGHSYIDDVSIVLRNTAGTVGIQVGDVSDPSGVFVKPYFSFIRANVWLNSQDGCGIKMVNRGELRLCLANIGVHGNGSGLALDLSGSTAPTGESPIRDSQRANPSSIGGFLLRAQNLSVNPINNSHGYNISGVKVVSF
ncbi:MAG: hypothetical protein FWC30_01135 [Candidatus Bathyarchaeota archaeon]|nr:hypothetical protein [Candidatus Termiticorpusculum sp.]